MQLLKMELRGFKSFADKTTLTFDKGITAIVGPNGSGKSNISDAVRWVMGEQNVRQLRGQKSEDIIFAGTEKRRPHGAAEVTLFFDNTDHQLDVDFTEVAVTRRIFRSGDSEFYINKRPCRLKDIHNLFADTGIGQDSLAVIGQNRVDRILNSKPEERRVIFEEVAGISRFKGRKQEGLRKIEETERNLERIRDMMAMLEERLGPLAAEAERTGQFRELDQERIAYEGTLALQELRNAERLLAKAENSRTDATAQYEEAATQLQAAGEQRQQLLTTMEQDEQTMRQLEQEASAAQNELDSMKHRVEAFTQRQQELQEQQHQLGEEQDDLKHKMESVQQDKADLVKQQQGRQRELDAARNGLALSTDLYKQAKTAAAAAEEALQEVVQANEARNRSLFVLGHERDDLKRRIEETLQQKQDVGQTLTQRQKAIELLREKHDHSQTVLEQIQAQVRQQEADMKVLQETLKQREVAAAEAEKQYTSLSRELAGLSQRIQVLEGMEQDHEGVSRAVKEVVTAATDWRSQVCGIVGELCSIPPQYAAALDVALGAAAQYVVTQDERTARSAISYLKQRHAGRTTFLPLDTVRDRHRTTDEERASQEPGIIGFANEVLQYEPAYEAVFSFLLGKTLIAGTIEEGAAVAARYHHRLRIVCLDGTQYNVGGSLTGGSMRAREGSLISRRALLEQLRQQQRHGRKGTEEAKQIWQERKAAWDETTALLHCQEKSLQEASAKLQQEQWQEKAVARDMATASQAVKNLQEQQERLEAACATLHQCLQEKEQAWTACSGQVLQESQELEEARNTAVQDMERFRQAVTEQQVQLATLQEQVRHVQEQLDNNETWRQQVLEEQQRWQQKQDGLQEKLTETGELLHKLADNIRVKEQDVQAKSEAKEAFYQSRSDHFKHSQDLDTTMDEFRRRAETMTQRISTADVQIEKYTGEIRRCEGLLEVQGLTRQTAMERRRSGSLRELNDKVASLRQQIEALGAVNPNADAEFEAAKKQREFFSSQCDDLVQARDKLQAVIAEIDSAMAEQFEKAFAEISTHFQRIFSRLFGGGQAIISLSTHKDVLNAGIEIFIQPPGKKQQQLTLLSGGERALTVIALLFSFLAYHPAPFCLVDEVDAALDEANVERLGKYLKNYSGGTQFIVITHRRKTMEAANILQGVTMEEKGVSRLLTVKVDDLLGNDIN